MLKKIGMFIALWLSLTACSDTSEKNEPPPTPDQNGGQQVNTEQGINVLEGLRHLVKKPGGTIWFDKDNKNLDQLLLRGWSSPEKNHVWAVGKKSVFLFYTYDTLNNKRVAFKCKAIPSLNNEKQVTTLYVNGNKVGKRPIGTHYKTYRLEIPAKYLNCGPNRLGLEYTYTTQPIELDKAQKDTRDLALDFKYFKVESDSHVSVEGQYIKQNAPSAMSFFVNLPEASQLDIAYTARKNCDARINIRNEEEVAYNIALSASRQNHRKTLKVEKPGIYKIQCLVKGDEKSHIEWKKIFIGTKTKEASQKASSQGFQKIARPNIFIYISDALRADHVGCYGYKRNTTPRIDQFAKNNIFYENAYSPTSWTRASGASIITGLLAKNHKTMKRNSALSEEIVTLPEMLKQNGYDTAAIITNGNISSEFGFNQGYDEFIALDASRERPTFNAYSDTVNERLFKLLDEHAKSDRQSPLFVLIWCVDPHGPYMPPEKTRSMFDISDYSHVDTYDLDLLSDIKKGEVELSASQKKFLETRYDQEIRFNDGSFGRFIDKLKAMGIYEDAVVFFASDHGEEFFDHGSIEHGNTVYNESVKVPFMLHYKNKQASRRAPVQLIDMMPTILDILALQPPYPLDGRSLLGDIGESRKLYFEQALQGNDVYGLLDGSHKIIFNRRYHRPPSERYVPVIEYFDLTDDPHEKENITSTGFYYRYLRQNLFLFKNRPSHLGTKANNIELSPELDQKLKELGYVK